MNIFEYICQEYFKEEWGNFSILIILGILLSLFYANLASYITANIIKNIKSGSETEINYYYYLFIGVSLIYIVLNYLYKYFQNKVLTKAFFWIKQEMLKVIIKVNNLNMSNVNFIDFMIPITRVASSMHSILNNLAGDLIPTISFIISISGYFLYKNFTLGITFFLANLVIIGYFMYFWEDIYNQKKIQEDAVVIREKYLIDLLNNFDKIIYKGQSDNEIENHGTKTNEVIDISIKISHYVINHCFTNVIFIYLIIFTSIWYLIRLQREKKIDVTTFISFFTIIIMYRDSLIGTLQSIPSIMEHYSRIDNVVVRFDEMVGSKEWIKYLDLTYNTPEITFDKIVFSGVDFKYSGTDSYILNNFNLTFSTNNKIIGITGLSGRGKTTFMKLLLRIYPCTKGTITIDGVNIEEIDPKFIRDNITFVNQSSRLFDRIVMENILYGCQDLEKCNAGLKEILKYPKIRQLYQNLDINNSIAGPLGDNLSGGQRQITNIIGGLINPSKILILDEPTNALDPELKGELLLILQNFRKYKKCIIIITHDKEAVSLFDETISI